MSLWKLYTVVKTILTFMVLATCSEKILVAVFASDNFAAEIRWESLERPKREPHAVDEFSRLTRVLAVAVAKHLCGAISAGTSRRHSWRWESPTRCPSRLASRQAKALFELRLSFAWVSKAWSLCWCATSNLLEVVWRGLVRLQPAFLNL